MLGDDDRTPVDVGDEAAFRYWADHRYIFRRVQETQRDEFIVSTVFWGHANHGPDKLFETMIYEGEPGVVLADQKPELAICTAQRGTRLSACMSKRAIGSPHKSLSETSTLNRAKNRSGDGEETRNPKLRAHTC